MKTSLAKALLAATFFSLASCGQNHEVTDLHDEVMTEQEFVNQEGTGTAPSDLEDLRNMKTEADMSASEQAQILAKYGHLDPQRQVPTKLLQKAVTYFEANQSRFANKNYISVIDFSKSSKKVRFWVINLRTGAVWGMHTSHGKGSDSNHDGYAESFSNVSGSNKSSLGYYRTAETYQGANGYSLRLDGLSTSNSRARARAIVVHGANYVSEQNVIQGRSAGCPAVTHGNRDKLINQIKGGSLIYADLSGVR